MTKTKITYHHYIGSLCLTLTLLLSACTNDDAPDNAADSERTLCLVPAAKTFEQVTTPLTRALPNGYEALEALNIATAFPNSKDMLTFIASGIENPKSQDIYVRRFTFFTTDWQTNISLKEGDQANKFYIYGFIPLSDDTSNEVAISLLSGSTSYEAGAKLQVKRLKALTASDVCVISGIKKVSDKTTAIAGAGIKPGEFLYQFNASSATADYACMLLDHLYAQLNLKMCIDADYYDLRTIKLKKLKLQILDPDNTEQGLNTVTADVTVTANSTGADPVSSITFTKNTTGGEPMTIYSADNETDKSGKELLTTYATIGIPAYTLFKAPQGASSQWLRIVSEYDVYDKHNNLVREGCTASNSFGLDIETSKQKAGYAHTINIKVQPTYLYVLSEPDLDNPTINIQ